MTATATDWEALQESWNAQQEGYLAARHQRLDLLAQLVRASGGPNPLVVDLACGTGSVTRAVLQVVPGARVVAVDADPVLLTIAGHTVGQDDRVTLHTGDLRQPGWAADLVEGPVDAVVSATALHWLTEARTAALYAELAGLLRTGFTHVALVDDGTISKTGPIKQVLTAPALSSLFGLPLELALDNGRWGARGA